MSTDEQRRFKIIPRNLTARADTLVCGNPVTTRPESGVENCFPGLEFDQRNLDKTFFPGLLFEFHHSAGIILRDFDVAGPASQFVKHADIADGVFLAYLEGIFSSRVQGSSAVRRIMRFTPPAGLDSWRQVRDLERGEVGVILCNGDALSRVANGAIDTEVVQEWVRVRNSRRETIQGVGDFILLFGERASFLTPDGVIDPDLVEPGSLTASLCSPWQYDFADCGCFYWASNKPDLVSSENQPERLLNFQRRDRSPEGDVSARSDDWIVRHGMRWDDPAVIMGHAEMIQRWQELPFVISGSETDRYVPRRSLPAKRLLDRAEIVDRLSRLAPVEHALAVEYLYAYYSLGPPAMRPAVETAEQARLFTAGAEILSVAIDEMRHMRAVNEILIELGRPWVLSRASVIGEDFDNNGSGFNKPFELAPLTGAQLDWFIEVEKASQNHDEPDEDTIDGMYTLILRSVDASPDFSEAEKVRLSHLIKIIVDEGVDHFARFTRAKAAIAGIPEKTYLKVQGAPQLLPEGDPDRVLQDAADAAYLVVLRSLDYAFKVGDAQRGAMVEAARRAMYNMDDAARSLATRSHGAMFDHDRYGRVDTAGQAGPAAGPMPMKTVANLVGEPLRPVLDRLHAAGMTELASRMTDRLDTMTAEFLAAAEGD